MINKQAQRPEVWDDHAYVNWNPAQRKFLRDGTSPSTEGIPTPWKMDVFRRTGRSMALANALIREAWENPGKQIPVKDHHPTREADRHLLRMLWDLVVKAGLEEHMRFNSDTNTIRVISSGSH